MSLIKMWIVTLQLWGVGWDSAFLRSSQEIRCYWSKEYTLRNNIIKQWLWNLTAHYNGLVTFLKINFIAIIYKHKLNPLKMYISTSFAKCTYTYSYYNQDIDHFHQHKKCSHIPLHSRSSTRSLGNNWCAFYYYRLPWIF